MSSCTICNNGDACPVHSITITDKPCCLEYAQYGTCQYIAQLNRINRQSLPKRSVSKRVQEINNLMNQKSYVSPAPASGARPSCTCATATPTYPVYRSAYHIPPCHLASREQHEAAEGARVLREEEIPAEEAKWRAKGASERTIARLIGTMKATAACLESVASAAPTPESPREAGAPCSYAGPGVCPHCFPAASTTEGLRVEAVCECGEPKSKHTEDERGNLLCCGGHGYRFHPAVSPADFPTTTEAES